MKFRKTQLFYSSNEFLNIAIYIVKRAFFFKLTIELEWVKYFRVKLG